MAVRLDEGLITANSGGSYLEWALAQASKDAGAHNGDGYLMKRDDDLVLVALADGVGSGRAAQDAANACLAEVAESGFQDISALFDRCHRKLSGMRGAALAVAVIDFGSKKMTWAALGDVDGIVHRTEAGSSGSTGILQKGGTLGLHYPGVHLQPQNLSDGCMIVLTSDGVSRRYREMRPMGLRPCDFAPACLEQFGRDNDDRTVLAVSFREGAA